MGWLFGIINVFHPNQSDPKSGFVSRAKFNSTPTMTYATTPKNPARARSDPHFGLDIRTSRRIIRQASLMMRNSRTKEREDVGWGYTNRTAGGQRE
jgi:hypothetical protein